MEKKLKYILAAIGSVIAAVLGFVGVRVLKSAKSGNDNLRDTAKSVEAGVGRSKEQVEAIGSTLNNTNNTAESIQRTSSELGDAVDRASDANAAALNTVSRIQQLIEERRKAIEEGETAEEHVEDMLH